MIRTGARTNFVFLILLAFVVGSFLVMSSRHVEAPYIYELANEVGRNGGSDSHNRLEIMYSAKIGTALFLLHMPNGRAGGIVWRVTENGGVNALAQAAYEATCFSCDEAYWSRVIFRDGYIPISAAIQRAVFVGFGTVGFLTGLAWLSKRLRQEGHDGIADHLDSFAIRQRER
jgi:hypothetical protein